MIKKYNVYTRNYLIKSNKAFVKLNVDAKFSVDVVKNTAKEK